jgi:ABC-type polysaccharide/polyol phosphate transport system ATPase subunit
LTENLVEVIDVWKKFRIPHEKKHSVFEEVVGLVGLAKGRRIGYEEYWALKGVSFELKEGEWLGVVGANGSGKTTLLKIMAGITPPTKGSIRVSARIAAILQLGVAFHPELTVKENILLYSSVMGIRGREARRRIPSILEFAGGNIDKFVDAKLKVLSSGMQLRLAFSVAINTDPDIFFIDESLAVGDLEFRQKCLETFESYKAKKAMILVTHDFDLLTQFCSRALWLSQGVVKRSGDPADIANLYKASSEIAPTIPS